MNSLEESDLGNEEKSVIQLKLKSKECKLVKNVGGKAIFWKYFEKVVYNNDKGRILDLFVVINVIY